MEHQNIVLNSLIILAVILIATPNEAGGYSILNYDEEAPTYPWERIVYRESLPRVQKRNDTDANGKNMGDLLSDLHPVTESKHMGIKRIAGVDENVSELKKYDKYSGVKIIYGRVSVPLVFVSSYPKPNQ